GIEEHTLSELSDLARVHRAEFLVVGTPSQYSLYQISPYGPFSSPAKRIPSWTATFRRRGLVSKEHTLLPFRDEEQLRKAFGTCHDVIFSDTAKDPAAAFDLLSLII